MAATVTGGGDLLARDLVAGGCRRVLRRLGRGRVIRHRLGPLLGALLLLGSLPGAFLLARLRLGAGLARLATVRQATIPVAPTAVPPAAGGLPALSLRLLLGGRSEGIRR